MKFTFLYVLICPESGSIRYVGKANFPDKRFRCHLATKEKCHRTNWINLLKSKGLMPRLEILFEVPENEWQCWEREYIKIFRSSGCPLVNGTLGGDGVVGYSPSEETRKKMSLAKKGRPGSRTGQVQSLETRKKLALANRRDSMQRGKRGVGTSSKYKGVSWRKDRKCWSASIVNYSKRIHLGCYQNERDAAVAYDTAAREYFGEFASPNFSP